LENLQNWERAVAERVLQGESASYETIVTAYQKSIYSLCYRMTGNSGDAEDLSQEVFIKAFRKLHTYDPSKRFSTWILTLGRNTCIDHLRRKKEDTLPFDEGSFDEGSKGERCGESAESLYIQDEEKEEIQQAVDSLSPEYRILILLYHQQGKSYQEIAELEGISLSLVKNRIHRGRKMLRDELLHLRRREKR